MDCMTRVALLGSCYLNVTIGMSVLAVPDVA